MIEFRVFLMFSLLVIDRAISILSKIRWVGYVLCQSILSMVEVFKWQMPFCHMICTPVPINLYNKQTNKQTMQNVQCSMWDARCSMFDVCKNLIKKKQCTMQNVRYSMHDVQCVQNSTRKKQTMHNVQHSMTIHDVQCSTFNMQIVKCAMFNVCKNLIKQTNNAQSDLRFVKKFTLPKITG